jgi:Holliday junction resolvase RusA-like endonuclease
MQYPDSFRFVFSKQERDALSRVAKALQRTQSDALRQLILAADEQIVSAGAKKTPTPNDRAEVQHVQPA